MFYRQPSVLRNMWVALNISYKSGHFRSFYPENQLIYGRFLSWPTSAATFVELVRVRSALSFLFSVPFLSFDGYRQPSWPIGYMARALPDRDVGEGAPGDGCRLRAICPGCNAYVVDNGQCKIERVGIWCAVILVLMSHVIDSITLCRRRWQGSGPPRVGDGGNGQVGAIWMSVIKERCQAFEMLIFRLKRNEPKWILVRTWICHAKQWPS